jgi:hypothetical protein
MHRWTKEEDLCPKKHGPGNGFRWNCRSSCIARARAATLRERREIRADASLDVGSPVEFEITLPPDVTGGRENVVIACKGRVVRTDPTGTSEDGRGVACVIDSYEFVRNG